MTPIRTTPSAIQRMTDVLTFVFLFFATSLLLIESNIVYLQIGPFSLAAYLTLVTPFYLLALISLLLISHRRAKGGSFANNPRSLRGDLIPITPFIVLLLLGLVSLGFSWRIEGLQNLLALAVFVTGVLASALVREDWVRFVAERAFPLTGLTSAVLFIITQIVDTETRFGIEFFSPRQYGMVALVALAAALATSRTGVLYKLAPYVIFASLIFSASRTVVAVGLIIFLISAYQRSSGWREAGAKIAILLGFGVIFSAIGIFAVRDVAERISGGGAEQTDILSDSGRFNAWAQFLSLPQSGVDWFVGLGSGASAEFGQRELLYFPQTLNEYLRFLLDQGILGLVLFVLGLMFLAYRAKPWLRTKDGSLEGAGLIVIALALVSFTDGAFYSYFVVLPASVLIGRMLQPESSRVREGTAPE